MGHYRFSGKVDRRMKPLKRFMRQGLLLPPG